MKLKNKIVVVSIVSIIVFCIMTYCIQKIYVLPTYSKIEQSEAGKDLCQAYEIVNKDIHDIKLLTEDIAGNKGTYNIEQYQTTLRILHADIFDRLINRSKAKVILIFDNKKKLVFKRLQPEMKNFNVESICKYINYNNLLFSEKDKSADCRSGLISTSRGIVIIGSAPIYNTEISKVVGSAVICLPLNRVYFESMSMQVKSPIFIYDLNRKYTKLPLGQGIIDSLKKSSSIYFQEAEENSDFSGSYRIISDINNKPVFLLAANLSRNIYLEAHSMINFALYVLIIFGVLLIFLTTNIIQFIVVRPISKLTKSTIKIRESEDLKLRTEFQFRKDEIGTLSIEFNNLLEQVQYHIEDMEEIIEEKTREIRSTREDTIFRLSMAIDDKDAGAGKHMKRVQQMMLLLAQKMKFRNSKCEMYSVASTLHDIGKIGVPEYILGKTGKYTNDEYDAMKTHTIIGGKIFSNSNSELVITAKQIAMYHHERWDGFGYPEGLKGENIPLPARMLAIIDIFNGMLSKRSYKEGSASLDEVIDYFKENSGKIFDPDILKIFIVNIDEFVKIREKYPDKF
jgi:response regulator RpfG family c-di-GMP phosphodiesterase/sensor domain CHASE-containing protein